MMKLTLKIKAGSTVKVEIPTLDASPEAIAALLRGLAQELDPQGPEFARYDYYHHYPYPRYHQPYWYTTINGQIMSATTTNAVGTTSYTLNYIKPPEEDTA